MTPTNWIITTLGEIVDFIGGGTPSKQVSTYWDGDIPWASIKDMKGDTLNQTQDSITELGLNESSANIAQPNEIILATRINPGKPIVTKIRTAINQDLKVVKPKIEIDTQFLFWAFRNCERQIIEISSGTTVLGVNLVNLNLVEISLPPLAEQLRIVAKIEELFSELDAGVESLKTALGQITTYRQSVLKSAFEGRLTEEWRKVHGSGSADELMKQIRKEREERYVQQTKEWETAVREWEKNGKEGKKPSKPSKPKELPPLSEDELADLPVLPDGWGWARVESVSKIVSGFAFKSTDFKSNGIPVTKIANVSYSKYLQKDQQFLPSNFEEIYGEFAIRKNDLLIALTRPITQNKVKVCRYPNSFTSLLNQRVAMYKDIAISELYFEYFQNSEVFKKHIKTKFSETLQPNLSPVDLGLTPIPLTSFAEQTQIVSEIESRLSVADALEQTIRDSLTKAETLRQSILKKAFEGRLVPQDPNDEPAELLLERIRADREKSGKKAGKK